MRDIFSSSLGSTVPEVAFLLIFWRHIFTYPRSWRISP